MVNVTRVTHPVRPALAHKHSIVLLVSKVQIFSFFGYGNTLKSSQFSLCIVCAYFCAAGYFLDQDGSCVVQCPSGSYANSATHLCEECSPNCESCMDNSNNCISCSKSSNTLFLHQGRCWSNCPE